MNEVRATWIFGVFEIIFFSPANKLGYFKNYFLEELLLTSVLSALENFVTFSRKPERLSTFLIMYWSSSPHLRKGGFRR